MDVLVRRFHGLRRDRRGVDEDVVVGIGVREGAFRRRESIGHPLDAIRRCRGRARPRHLRSEGHGAHARRLGGLDREQHVRCAIRSDRTNDMHVRYVSEPGGTSGAAGVSGQT